MPAPALDRIPGGYEMLAMAVAARRLVTAEWAASPLRRLGPRPEGFAARPRDLRPPDLESGRQILAGAFVLLGETVAHGQRGDPWDRASPSRRFATALHQFGWLGDLLAAGNPGAAEGLRLTLAWRRLFGGGTGFSWTPDILERRVFNLACAARALCAGASDAETDAIANHLARQARALLAADAGPLRASERAAVAAVAGAALAGRAGELILARALRRLSRALPETVDPDGGHATRSPQAALELFFDLSTLDEALTQRGVAAPEALSRAIEALSGAVRFFTLGDGALAAFQGGEAMNWAYVAAARAEDQAGERSMPARRNGYHRLETRSLQVMADAAAPAGGPWSLGACGQPLAIEVLAGGRRLITGSGWSPEAMGPPALRLVEAASTCSVAEAPCGESLGGQAARQLGARLRDPCQVLDARRQEAPGALWLELSHDGWAERFGLRHERRLYLDGQAEELRGEDRLTPLQAKGPADRRRFAPFAVRFHLHPQVSALIAQDKRSVLLKIEGDDAGWWLRNDALDVTLEPSVHYQGGRARRSQQIVLRGQARLDAGAKVRWKLSPVGSRVDEAPPSE